MTLDQLLEHFHIDSNEVLEWQARYNVAPTLDIPVIVELSDGTHKLMKMKWGLVPPWATGSAYKPIINLRTETLLSKPGFKRIFERSRCLVPVDGFNEWGVENKKKIPYRFTMKSGAIFGLGGIYDTVILPDGKSLHTVSLITTEANKLVSAVHDRMPVIIPRPMEPFWLNPTSKIPDFVTCMAPYPPEEMRSYRVSTLLNTAKNDTSDLISPVP
jgi:putative SOS response-associated peptidase YedK